MLSRISPKLSPSAVSRRANVLSLSPSFVAIVFAWASACGSNGATMFSTTVRNELHVGGTNCNRVLTIFQHQFIEKRVGANQRQLGHIGFEADLICVGTKVDRAAKQTGYPAHIARPVVDKTNRKRRYVLPDKLPAKPQQSSGKEFNLLPVPVSRHPSVFQHDAANVA